MERVAAASLADGSDVCAYRSALVIVEF